MSHVPLIFKCHTMDFATFTFKLWKKEHWKKTGPKLSGNFVHSGGRKATTLMCFTLFKKAQYNSAAADLGAQKHRSSPTESN